MCGEFHLVLLEKKLFENDFYLKSEGEKSSSYSKFISEKVWLYLKLGQSFWLLFFCTSNFLGDMLIFF
jgi:hypothetical protein